MTKIFLKFFCFAIAILVCLGLSPVFAAPDSVQQDKPLWKERLPVSGGIGVVFGVLVFGITKYTQKERYLQEFFNAAADSVFAKAVLSVVSIIAGLIAFLASCLFFHMMDNGSKTANEEPSSFLGFRGKSKNPSKKSNSRSFFGSTSESALEPLADTSMASSIFLFSLSAGALALFL